MQLPFTRVFVAIVLPALAATSAAQGVQMKSVTRYPTGFLPHATALADMDRDGDLDVIVPTAFPAGVQVLVNNGGVLAAGASLYLNSSWGGVASFGAADLDGDGDADLAVTLWSGVLALVENVSGALVIHGSMSLSDALDDVVVGDLDGDGDHDVVASRGPGRALFVLWNRGNFAFDLQAYPISPGMTSLALGQVTGLGQLDVVVVNKDTNQVSVWWPVDLGFWALAPLPPVTLDSVNPLDVCVGDVDGNGFDDLVCVGSESQSVAFGRAQVVFSNGGAALHKGTAFSPKSGLIGCCALADLDLDGKLDLALGSFIGMEVVVYVNQGGGDFTGIPYGFPTSASGIDMKAADLDGDGGADLVEICQDSAEVWVLLNAASGRPCALSSYCTAKIHSLGGVASIGASGLPSFGAQGFALMLDAAIPDAVAIGIAGSSGPASLPFAGGLLCVTPPLTRLAPLKLSPGGRGSLAVPVTTSMIAATRWYQWWFRDPAHPDGTGVGLSDGLQVTFCQ